MSAKDFDDGVALAKRWTCGVRTSDTFRTLLKTLHDTNGLSWRESSKIVAQSIGVKVPHGTLCSVYHGREIPTKHLYKLGISMPKKEIIACTICGEFHPLVKNCHHRKRHTKGPRDLFAMKPDDLRAAYENRVVVCDENQEVRDGYQRPD